MLRISGGLLSNSIALRVRQPIDARGQGHMAAGVAKNPGPTRYTRRISGLTSLNPHILREPSGLA